MICEEEYTWNHQRRDIKHSLNIFNEGVTGVLEINHCYEVKIKRYYIGTTNLEIIIQ